MAYVLMAYIVMAYVVMAYVAMAWQWLNLATILQDVEQAEAITNMP